jgi:SAM-dependent methyltransferase
MFAFLLPHLRCPEGGGLTLQVGKTAFHPVRREDEIIEGSLTSDRTGRVYPIRNGIPRLLPDELDRDTRTRFELEWKHWARGNKIYGMDKATYRNDLFTRRSGVPLDAASFAGKVVLEGGCGHGMAGEIVAPLAREYIGVDLGEGIEAARERTAGLGNAHLIQGSLLSLPLASGTADFAYSIGVIHHTSDPHKAFSELSRSLKADGSLLIWVYPREGALFETLSGAARLVTTRLPAGAVYALSWLLVPLVYVVQPYADSAAGRNTWHENMQSIYDWLSPRYQFHYSPAELSAWFTEQGLGDLRSAPVRTGIIGRKMRPGA